MTNIHYHTNQTTNLFVPFKKMKEPGKKNCEDKEKNVLLHKPFRFVSFNSHLIDEVKLLFLAL